MTEAEETSLSRAFLAKAIEELPLAPDEEVRSQFAQILENVVRKAVKDAKLELLDELGKEFKETAFIFWSSEWIPKHFLDILQKKRKELSHHDP